MRSSLSQTIHQGAVRIRAFPLLTERFLRPFFLSLITLLAAFLRFIDLSALGYANHYYAAAVTSMLASWHNFFFVAAEPGGLVSVDKPPLGLWIQAISAHFLGVNTLGLLLPEILAGIASILVLYHLVQRSYGTIAGLLAGLALAVTPIVVATDRNNTIDSILILFLLLAAWAFIKATETRRLWTLILGAVLVGLAFNVKMLQAYLPLPAFLALYFLGADEKLWLKVRKLALAGLVILGVSFSWATIVQLTPASQRPFVGSSGDNSVFSLIFGYNGIERLVGMGGMRGGWSGRGSSAPGFPGLGGQQPSQGGNPFGNGNRLAPQGRNGFGSGGNGSNPGGSGGFFNPGSNFGRGGGFPAGGSQPGLTRLLSTPLSKEMSWLLPFGLVSLVVILLGIRLRWPLEKDHAMSVLWGGWLVTGLVFFSVAGFFHEYYLATLAPPLAALVGIGVVRMWKLRAARPWMAAAALLLAGGWTLALQIDTASAYVNRLPWNGWILGLFAVGLVCLGLDLVLRLKWAGQAAMACLVAAMLVTPTAWSYLTAVNSSSNQSLPAAYSGVASGPQNRGGIQVNQELLQFLQENTQGVEYLMAVPSSMQGSDYILATGRPVLYLGGFMGQDQVVTPDRLAQMVAQGQLRYIYWNSGGRGMNVQGDISAWVTQNCQAVNGYQTRTQNSGAPDGTGSTQTSMGNMLVDLYDCGTGM